LKALPCIRLRFDSGRYYAWEFEQDSVELAVEVDGPLTMNDQSLMIQAAIDGVGFAYAFERQIEQHVADGRLVRVLDNWCPYYSGFYLYYPSRRQLPAAMRALVDFIRSDS
jgi:DNA-binding transcriptional LysR family regulator